MGHGFQTKFGCNFPTILLSASQVAAWFHWLDFIKQQGQLCGKELLHVALDETCVRKADVGLGIVVKQSWWSRFGRRPGAREQRSSCTYVCLASPDTAFQAKLPQVWLGNRRNFRQRSLAECSARQPQKVLLWREKSAWVTKSVMLRVLAEIAGSAGDGPQQASGAAFRRCAPAHFCGRV